MAINANNEERGFGADGERQRVSQESRSARQGGSDPIRASSDSTRGRSNRGFASMDREKQREIASKGGRAAHQKGTAHEFDSGEARAAGRKGGMTVSRNREHMAAIGRRGGEARGANRAARQQNGASSARTPGQSAATSPRFQGDREVGLSGSLTGQNATGGVGTGQSRSSGNSLGGERTGGTSDERNVERP